MQPAVRLVIVDRQLINEIVLLFCTFVFHLTIQIEIINAMTSLFGSFAVVKFHLTH